MNLRAHWQFYKSIFPFIAAFALVGIIALGALWGFVVFCSLGLWFGFFGFSNFRKDDYYFYHNLGLTRWHLIKSSFIINLIVGLPVFILLVILFLFLFGRFTII
jgi:hypothetical protein